MEPKPMATPDLGGLLSRARRSKPPRVEVAPDSADPVAAAVPAASEPRERAAAVPDAAVEVSEVVSSASAADRVAAGVYGQNVTLYMPAEVDRAMRESLRGSGVSLTRFILSAVNAHHASLGEWLGSSGRREGDLFSIPQPVRSGPTARTTIRVTEEQLVAVDGLAAQFGVPRTQVLVAAIRAELGMPARSV